MAAAFVRQMTQKKKDAFLQALADTGNVEVAAKRVSTAKQTLYWHRKRDAVFARAWQEALETAMDAVLEPEAVRRAVTGVLKPVYQGGEKVGAVREYSDTLLIFLLKGGKPHKYKDRVDLTFDIRALARKVAAELGIDPVALIAEAEALLAEGTLITEGSGDASH